MVTLTFNEYSLNQLTNEVMGTGLYHKLEENEVCKIALRRFLERWRKRYKVSVRHWLITELGHTSTERIHLHGIIFTDKPSMIEHIWSYGYVYLGDYVNEKTINYIIKYVTKIDKDHKGYKPKIFTSSGIGKSYLLKPDSKLNKFNGTETALKQQEETIAEALKLANEARVESFTHRDEINAIHKSIN